MVIEGDRKNERHDEENCENELIVTADDGQANEVDGQNHQFCRDHVDQNGAHEKPFLTIEHNRAGRTLIFYFERMLSY